MVGKKALLTEMKKGNRPITTPPLQLPFAHGTSSENNAGNRAFHCYALAILVLLRYGDRSRDRDPYLEIAIY